MHTRTRYLTTLVAMALVAVACGGGSADDTTTTAPQKATTSTPPETTEATTTTEAPPETEATTTTEAPPETVDPPAPPPTTIPFEALPSLLGADGDDDTRGPGEYRAEKLSHGIRHDITDEVSVRGDGQVFYLLGLPGFDVRTDGAVFFTDVAGLPLPENVGVHCHDCDPDGYTPIHSVDELDAFFAETPGVVLLDSGTSSDGMTLDHWWEFTTDNTAPRSFDENCNFGEQCLNIMYVDGCCYFLAGEDWTYRLWRLGHGEGALYAWFQARNDEYADALPFGEMIVEGATVIDHHH